jgi:hypothetical protein
MVELADASTGDGSVKAGTIARAAFTRRVLGEISAPMGRPAFRPGAIPITSDNICHIKSRGVGSDWRAYLVNCA